ncbi:MAG: hypothetical protein A3E80_04700 [Chlamydiae bacterium RIFCSPHIGHO2_12_FULL_49_9]|nr:MAG: hypothetical protein A3E80_04700 [Chlamydiae bacterium RIFCSPHIGHO2_12_FULL_49_9]
MVLNEIKQFLPRLPQLTAALEGVSSRLFLGVFKISDIKSRLPIGKIALQMFEGRNFLKCADSSLATLGKTSAPLAHRLVVYLTPLILATAAALLDDASALRRVQDLLVPMYRIGYAVSCLALIYFGSAYLGASSLLALGIDVADGLLPPYFQYAGLGGFIILNALNGEVASLLILGLVQFAPAFFDLLSESEAADPLPPATDVLTFEIFQNLENKVLRVKPEALTRIPKPVIPAIDLNHLVAAFDRIPGRSDDLRAKLTHLIASLEVHEKLPLHARRYKKSMRDYLKVIAHYVETKGNPSLLLRLMNRLYRPEDKDFPESGNFQAIEEIYREIRSDLEGIDLQSKILFHLEDLRRDAFLRERLIPLRKERSEDLFSRIFLGSYLEGADCDQWELKANSILYGLYSPSAEANKWALSPPQNETNLCEEFLSTSAIEKAIPIQESREWWELWRQKQEAQLPNPTDPTLIRAMLVDIGIFEALDNY